MKKIGLYETVTIEVKQNDEYIVKMFEEGSVINNIGNIKNIVIGGNPIDLIRGELFFTQDIGVEVWIDNETVHIKSPSET